MGEDCGAACSQKGFNTEISQQGSKASVDQAFNKKLCKPENPSIISNHPKTRCT